MTTDGTADGRIASVDAVIDGTIEGTLSVESRGRPIRGAFVTFRAGEEQVLARITAVNMTNRIHQDDRFAPHIMVNGKVDHWSGEIDVERVKIMPVSVIDVLAGERRDWRCNPSSGTPVMPASVEDMERFVNEREHVLRLGTIPNSNGLPSTIINRHFGPVEEGGFGEARHGVIVGQNGSAKTVLALMLVAGQLAAHPRMGLFMPDTAGDLSDPTRHDRGGFRWNYVEVLKEAGVSVEIIDARDIRLTSTTVLKEKLAPVFRRTFQMGQEKHIELAARIVNQLFDREVDGASLSDESVLECAARFLGDIYPAKTAEPKIELAERLLDDPGRRRDLTRQLNRVRSLFDGRVKLGDLIRGVLEDGRKVVIRMDGSRIDWDDQNYVMQEAMEGLKKVAADLYRSRRNRPANALVVLDEGTRWVPEGDRDKDSSAAVVKEAYRETRKYGLGWLVIAQRPSEIAKTILTQSHMKWFGRGLGTGTDGKHLAEHLGQAGHAAYQRLEMQGGYFWLGIGQSANIGTESTYFELHPFGGDATRAFIEANPHIFAARGGFGGIL